MTVRIWLSRNNVAVKLVRGVSEVLIQQFQTLGTRKLVPLIHVNTRFAGLDGGTLLA